MNFNALHDQTTDTVVPPFHDTDTSSSAESDMEDFLPKNDAASYQTATSRLRLPRPKRHRPAPPPPPPNKVIPVSIAKTVLEASREAPEEIVVSVDEFRREGIRLAESNTMVSDKTQFNGVGYDRAKSRLTYLAKLDAETRGKFEKQMQKRTRAKAATNKIYGW
jgi:hypothetical protein